MLDFPFDPKCPANPRAFIALKTFSTECFPVKSGKKGEFILLSPDCATFEELQSQADRLIKELEEIKKRGKTFFEEEKKKIKKQREAKEK